MGKFSQCFLCQASLTQMYIYTGKQTRTKTFKKIYIFFFVFFNQMSMMCFPLWQIKPKRERRIKQFYAKEFNKVKSIISYKYVVLFKRHRDECGFWKSHWKQSF